MFRASTLALLTAVSVAGSARAQTVPDGFLVEQVVGEPFIQQPVAFTWLPDGRPVLTERPNGVVRIAAAGVSASDSVFTVPGVEGAHPERGLLGVAADPAWPTRPYLYFHLTHVDSVTKIVRYTASGALSDPASTAVTLADEYVLLDDIEDLNGIHNAGTLRFGADGLLYVSLGDDAQSCQSQDLMSPLGKILRLDVSSLPAGGGGPPPKADLTPASNPFPGPDPWERLVYAWGLRNPFRFTVDAPTGDVFIGSVGSSLYEEINRVAAGGGSNYGWPQWEGDLPITCCGTCGQGNTFTDAIHLVPHPLGLISVCGGPVMRPVPSSPRSFPPAYDGDYFYVELFGGTLHRLQEAGGTWDFAPPVPGQPDSVTWGTGLYGASDAQLGPDGALWILSFGYCCGFARGLYRIGPDPAVTEAVPAAPPRRTRGITVRPNPVRPATGATIRWTAGTSGAARLYDARGRLVREFPGQPGEERRSVFWDGRDATGRRVPPGVYVLRADGGHATLKVTVLH